MNNMLVELEIHYGEDTYWDFCLVAVSDVRDCRNIALEMARTRYGEGKLCANDAESFEFDHDDKTVTLHDFTNLSAEHYEVLKAHIPTRTLGEQHKCHYFVRLNIYAPKERGLDFRIEFITSCRERRDPSIVADFFARHWWPEQKASLSSEHPDCFEFENGMWRVRVIEYRVLPKDDFETLSKYVPYLPYRLDLKTVNS